ncbi:hypothetical protein KIN20_032495 [Parelaphostrongylus tenuis]|uniref:Conserved oligomeric Golgi complex subunit 7 n=1 Tax=Parelaphostrongylus tenuis TaxID=148309 RepID=A0AAD5R782_PARTN|nr:hypothetical protein KIN20_032495 [Parelaphostrongylus tenuis]
MPAELDVRQVQQPAAELLSSLCEGHSREERRKVLNEHLMSIQKQYDSSLSGIERTKASIEEARVKYENMNDMIRTLEQLKCSLEQHIRTVRLNESSFAGTSAVLEYDAAKTRTNNLISVIKARSQWERAGELLKEEGKEDQQKMYECLADMQASQEILAKYVSKGFDIREFEEMKDRFLAWQSAALIFAIQQADFEKLAEIQKTYENLGRKDEFISIFRRVSSNRLREFSSDGATIQSIIASLYKELEFVFTHHHKVLRRFLNDGDATTLLSQAIEEGLNELDLSASFANLISADENPVELLQKISKVLTTRSEVSSKITQLAGTYLHVRTKIIHSLVAPFRSALTAYVLTKINTFDFEKGSFRVRVGAMKTSIAELLHFMTDVFVQSEALFGANVKDVVQQSIDKALENFMMKMQVWKPLLEAERRTRPIEDVISVCASSGQLVYGLQEFKAMVISIEPSLSPNIKEALKWNRSVCNFVIRSAIDKVVLKMKSRMNEIKSTESKDSRITDLPTFGTSPHEYITTVGQELLQLFHLWEQFFHDENVAHAFYIALKKKYEGDELFKKTVAEVANNVIAEFVTCVGDPLILSRDAAKQFYTDTIFLKDAFEDLRTGNVSQLSKLEEELKHAITKN